MRHPEQIVSAFFAALATAFTAPALAEDATGEIVSVDARTVSVREPDGETTRYEFDPQVAVACPNEPVVSVLDLRRGQTVTVTYDEAGAGNPHPTAVRIELDDEAEIDRRWRLQHLSGERRLQ